MDMPMCVQMICTSIYYIVEILQETRGKDVQKMPPVGLKPGTFQIIDGNPNPKAMEEYRKSYT